jgi:hypothetical protein
LLSRTVLEYYYDRFYLSALLKDDLLDPVDQAWNRILIVLPTARFWATASVYSAARLDRNHSLVRLHFAERRTRPRSRHLRLRRFPTHHCWHRHRSLAARRPRHGSCYARPSRLVHPRRIPVVLSAGERCLAAVRAPARIDPPSSHRASTILNRLRNRLSTSSTTPGMVHSG